MRLSRYPTRIRKLAMTTDEAALQLPAQTIPVPRSISAQGQAYLAAAAKRLAAQRASGPVKEGVLDQRAQAAAAVQFLRPLASRFAGSVNAIVLPSGANLYRMTPQGRTGRLSEVAYVDIHGGGFTSGGGEMCQLLAKIRASDYGAEVYAVDYRLVGYGAHASRASASGCPSGIARCRSESPRWIHGSQCA
jgi:monoterpene epsilon-lactone hydrolase